MLKIIIVSLITLFLSVIIKQKNPEISIVINVCGSLLIFIFSFEYLKEIFSFYVDISGDLGISDNIIKLAIKILGIGYLTEFVEGLACDFGNSVVASKVVFGGKVVICLLVLPVIRNLLFLLFSFS